MRIIAGTGAFLSLALYGPVVAVNGYASGFLCVLAGIGWAIVYHGSAPAKAPTTPDPDQLSRASA